jgi:tRNA 2-thiouridine synthesizing protein A|tara:strand:- start:6402 stop:6632 length:231 start_codon:yes stop_codon:yes gene_type:complete
MISFDFEVDAIGLKCPMPILRCKKGLNSMEMNQILKISTTDKNAARDLKVFCQQTGHELISFEIVGNVTSSYIRKN